MISKEVISSFFEKFFKASGKSFSKTWKNHFQFLREVSTSFFLNGTFIASALSFSMLFSRAFSSFFVGICEKLLTQLLVWDFLSFLEKLFKFVEENYPSFWKKFVHDFESSFFKLLGEAFQSFWEKLLQSSARSFEKLLLEAFTSSYFQAPERRISIFSRSFCKLLERAFTASGLSFSMVFSWASSSIWEHIFRYLEEDYLKLPGESFLSLWEKRFEWSISELIANIYTAFRWEMFFKCLEEASRRSFLSFVFPRSIWEIFQTSEWKDILTVSEKRFP